MTIKEGIAAAFGGIAAAWAAAKFVGGNKTENKEAPKAGESEATTTAATPTPATVETAGETKEEKENA